MNPKEYKQMMDYLTRSGIKKQIKFASDIARPDPKPVVKEIELFNEFNKRNPRADGGRIGFKDGPPKRMYSGRMMTEEQIQAIRDRRKVPKKEGMVYDKETKTFRPRKDFQNIDRSIFTAPKAAETKAKKTTTKLKNL